MPESRGRRPPRKARRGPTPSSQRAARAPAPEDVAATPTGRVTRPRPRGPFRPTWHKVVGAVFVFLGVGLFAVNDLALFDVEIMPGGHNEIWAPVAIAIGASSMWWFGWFDRPPGKRW